MPSCRAEPRPEDILIVRPSALTPDDKTWLGDEFIQSIFPVLTPRCRSTLRIRSRSSRTSAFPSACSWKARPAPRADDGALSCHCAAALPRFIRLPDAGNTIRYITLEDVVSLHTAKLFPGLVSGAATARSDHHRATAIRSRGRGRRPRALLRNGAQAPPARFGDPHRDRFENAGQPAKFVVQELNVPDNRVAVLPGLLALKHDVGNLQDPARRSLFEPYNPRFPERVRDHGGDCLAAIREKDMIVHHPYESFDVVVQFPAAGGARSRRSGHQAADSPYLQ